MKSAKQQEDSGQDRPEAAIEVWREGDRVLIGGGVPAAGDRAKTRPPRAAAGMQVDPAR